jgi:8-oxo-dGTP diphosphatase
MENTAILDIKSDFLQRINEPHDGSIGFYTAGFLFRNNGSEVALVKKNRPAWQAGKLNGIGGKMELNENAIDCMQREFREETGADISDWRPFAILQSNENTWQVVMFSSHSPAEVSTTSDEEIGWYKLSELSSLPVVPNLQWLIPLAKNEKALHSIIVEQDRVEYNPPKN